MGMGVCMLMLMLVWMFVLMRMVMAVFVNMVCIRASRYRGDDKLAVKDTFCSEDRVCDGADGFIAAAHDYHLKTIALIEMHMRARDYLVHMMVLNIVEFVAQIVGMVIEYHGKRSHDLRIWVTSDLVHKGVAHDISNCL